MSEMLLEVDNLKTYFYTEEGVLRAVRQDHDRALCLATRRTNARGG